ncbi:MAG: DUF6057 family protein [Bacteroidales bacterium]|nr:DUF6057 family protein [Bacteroidales bacterium]
MDKQKNKLDAARHPLYEMKWRRAITSVLFVSVCYLFLMLFRSSYLQMTAKLSLFLNESSFFYSYLQRPGGLLHYFGQFFSQFLLIPWLGAALCVLLLLCLATLVRTMQLFHPKNEQFSYIPPLLLLGSITNMGEMLSVNVNGGYFFSTILGWIFIAALYSLTSRLKLKSIYGECVSAIGAGVLLWAGGVYGVIAFLFLMLRAVLKGDTTDRIYALLVYLISLAVFLFAGYFFLYPHDPLSSIWMAHLKEYPFAIGKLPLIFEWSVIAFLALGVLFSSKLTRVVLPQWLGSGLLVLAFLAVGILSRQGQSENTRCRMIHSAEKEEWEKLLSDASRPGASMPLIAVALAKENKLLDKLFEYVQPTSRNILFETPNEQLSIVNIHVLRSLGLYYYAYHLAYENMVFRAPSIGSFQQLGELSLINNETELAKKYLTTLSHAWLWKKEAESSLQLAEHPELLEKKFSAIRQLQPSYDYLGSPYSGFESMVIYNYAYSQRNVISLQYAVAALLLQKRIQELPNWMQSMQATYNPSLPLHVQQALALRTGLDPTFVLPDGWVDANVNSQLKEFLKLYSSAKDPKAAMNLTKLYKQTYWYYYMFAAVNSGKDENASYDQR